LITKTIDETKGKCDAELIEVESANESNKKLAIKLAEIASIKADTINTIGSGEA